MIVNRGVGAYENCSASIENENGETALDIARRLKHAHCEELVNDSALFITAGVMAHISSQLILFP